MKPVAHIKRVIAVGLWADFIRTLEATIRKESVFDGGNVWEVARQGPCRISLHSATCPSFGADVEFHPSSRRVECVFEPAGNVRVFELGFWTSSVVRRKTGLLRIPPRRLAASLVDLICYGGNEDSLR